MTKCTYGKCIEFVLKTSDIKLRNANNKCIFTNLFEHVPGYSPAALNENISSINIS